MGSAPRTNQPHEALPPEIYLPLVDSLFKEGRTLFAGTILGAGSILITYWKTGEALLLYCAIAVLLVAALRGLMMRAYLRIRPTIKTVETARRWEYCYVAGAATSISLYGLWCFSRVRAHFRSVHAARQFLDDDRVHHRHFRAQLRQRAFRCGADLLRLGADHRGAIALRQFLSLDLRRPSDPGFSGAQVHRRSAAQHAAGCR